MNTVSRGRLTGINGFYAILAGQLVSTIGSGMTRFGLGVGRVVKRFPKLRPLVTALGGIMMILLVATSLAGLGQMAADFSPSDLRLNVFGIIQLLVLAFIAFFIFVGVQVAGVRYALEGKGLFQPTLTIQTMFSHRPETTRLVINMILLDIVAVLAIAVALVLLLLPGLFMLVIFSLAQWYLLAQYGKSIGLTSPEEREDIGSIEGY